MVHCSTEEKQGQVNLTPEDISTVYDVLNDFDSVTKERDDKLGNQNALVVKGKNGKSFVLVTEKGKAKAEVKTFYKKKEHPSMPDAKSPGLNAQSDSKGVILDSNISQEQEKDNKNQIKNSEQKKEGKTS